LVRAVRKLSTTCPFEWFARETNAELGSPRMENHMGPNDVLVSKLEEALAGLEGAFAGVWGYLLPDAKICLAELELIREVIQALKERAVRQAF
jgi:hypothetical protein